MGKLIDTLQAFWKGDQWHSVACHCLESSTIYGKPSCSLQCNGSGTEEGYQDETGIGQSNLEERDCLEKWGPHDFELLACVEWEQFQGFSNAERREHTKFFP
jgi:hypothetical protein